MNCSSQPTNAKRVSFYFNEETVYSSLHKPNFTVLSPSWEEKTMAHKSPAIHLLPV